MALIPARLLRILRSRSGQSLVELALVLPLLVALLLGVIDLSRVIYAKNTITNLSREGANLAARTQIDAEEIMTSLANTAKPLAMAGNGMMCITEVKNTGGVVVVQPAKAWSKNSGDGSRVQQDGSNLKNFLGDVEIGTGESKFIFEAGYQIRDTAILPADLPQLHVATVF